MFKYTAEEWEKLWHKYEQDIAEEFLHTNNPLELHQVLQSARLLKAWLEEHTDVCP